MIVFSRKDLLYSALVPPLIRCDRENRGLSLEGCAELICKKTPKELCRAVKETGRVLYRGEDVKRASILALKPDLLDESTYNDPEALAYFRCMETFLEQKQIFARPSTGHIATSSIEDAIPWGNPVSIWPLRRQWSYLWAENRKLLYPGSCDQNNQLVINEGLSIALQAGREVLFSTADETLLESRVLAIPSDLTAELMALLNEKRYGL
jgi:hypothetical protein